MQLPSLLLIPFLAHLTNAQSFPFPSIPDPASFAASPDFANGQSSSSNSFSSSSSSFSDGQGSSSSSHVSTTCDANAKCETHVNGFVNGTAVGVATLVTSTVRRVATSTSSGVGGTACGSASGNASGTLTGSGSGSEQTAGPVGGGGGGLLGGNANLATSGTAGSTVVVTGVPPTGISAGVSTGAAKLEEGSSGAGRVGGGMERIIMLALGIAMGAFIL
ncbi:hypothetical protein SBOR_7229 [Sclerotinia borealis F-4128]|uniref:GPI anchored protein n=1 Tax=Sclerotinia borealis (strain F-4128) TaxID=1432307 RepID=W9CC15_SCLBF|nr:hypothetical protein SBOR_7229 [Sclerotinia borealis F-4128]